MSLQTPLIRRALGGASLAKPREQRVSLGRAFSSAALPPPSLARRVLGRQVIEPFLPRLGRSPHSSASFLLLPVLVAPADLPIVQSVTYKCHIRKSGAQIMSYCGEACHGREDGVSRDMSKIDMSRSGRRRSTRHVKNRHVTVGKASRKRSVTMRWQGMPRFGRAATHLGLFPRKRFGGLDPSWVIPE
jgi:hypothetical protein